MKITRALLGCMAGFILVLGAPDARGDVFVQWKASDGGNDHYYDFVDFGTNTSWTEANAYASSHTYLGLSGHLVTENSQPEDDFLHNAFGSYIGDPNTGVPGIYAWIGLTDIGSTGSFHWITGEPLTYTNWRLLSLTSSEPSTTDTCGSGSSPARTLI